MQRSPGHQIVVVAVVVVSIVVVADAVVVAFLFSCGVINNGLG